MGAYQFGHTAIRMWLWTLTATSYLPERSASGLQFIPVTPCRIADTRNANGPLGGPAITGGTKRDFPILSGSCGIPATAVAYSFNVAAVPQGSGSGNLTVWPTGATMPNTSALNYANGAAISNGVIVPAGTNGSVSIWAYSNTDVVVDIDGYFVPAGTDASGLQFIPVTPCRIADTRNANGPLGGPAITGGTRRDFPILSGSCGIPATAVAYSFNVAAVPQGSGSGNLTVWPTGATMPNTSALNYANGAAISNGVIVPAGTNGSVSIWAYSNTDVVVDIDGYFVH